MAVDADTADGQVSEPSTSGSPASADSEATAAQPEQDDASHGGDAECVVADDSVDDPRPAATKPQISPVRMAAAVGVVVVVALAVLAGWLGFRTYQSHQAEAQRQLFLQVGRQGALNLTTIDYQHADDDIQRILDSAIGSFYDDFSKRSQPFVDVVKQAQSKSEGAITEAGLESHTNRDAEVLVAVTVKTSNATAAQQEPRSWRMRISVTKFGDKAKVSNVQFIP